MSRRVLLLGTFSGGKCCAATLQAVTAAKKISDSVTVLLAGHKIDSVVSEAVGISGISRVIYAENEKFAHNDVSALTSLLLSVQTKFNFTHIVGSHTYMPRSVLPRLASLLNIHPLSGVTSILPNNSFIRPTFAGNAIVTLQRKEVEGKPFVLTVSPTAFEPSIVNSSPCVEAEKYVVDENELIESSEFVSSEVSKSSRPELTIAKIVVGAGRGMGSSKEKFDVVGRLADKLKAAIGVTRVLVDTNVASNDLQVGQTGKSIAPDLYFALGISGAIQHLSGVKDAKTIVACNKDGDAPIFESADIGVVDDAVEFSKKLIELLD